MQLPVSFPAAMNDTWLSLPTVGGPVNPERYPGTDRGKVSKQGCVRSDTLTRTYYWIHIRCVSR